jgi:hypothetical protein
MYNNILSIGRASVFMMPCWALPPTRTGTTIALDPTFGSFTLLKPVSQYVNQFLFWWKCFRLFRLEWILLVFRLLIDTGVRCTTSSYLLAGPVCLWCLVLFHHQPIIASKRLVIFSHVPSSIVSQGYYS